MAAEWYSIRFFTSPEPFLREAARARGGCMLIDVGERAMREMKLGRVLQELGVRLPLIVLSERGDEASRREARSAGASFFLRKPVDERTLTDAIDWVIASGPEQGGPPEASPRPGRRQR